MIYLTDSMFMDVQVVSNLFSNHITLWWKTSTRSVLHMCQDMYRMTSQKWTSQVKPDLCFPARSGAQQAPLNSPTASDQARLPRALPTGCDSKVLDFCQDDDEKDNISLSFYLHLFHYEEAEDCIFKSHCISFSVKYLFTSVAHFFLLE